ncbi:MAG TPA: glycosyltransferase family 2 protein [Acidobacteriota bacterium]|nr:glycosyltransferase family 2 protein [Acidobacteriota bacterium]
MKPPLVSVIVVNHNRADLLGECLASLVAQTYPSLEILVVDNASSDSSRALVSHYPDSRVRLIELDGNLGFGVPNNIGMKAARGDLIALLNNDAVADPCWLERLVKRISVSPEVGLCASKILVYGTNVIDKAGHLMYPDGQNRGRGTGETDHGQYDQPEEVFFPDGCAALYRREAVEAVGGFDPHFFAYADDADLGIRCRLKGWKCLYEPGAIVHHRRSATSGAYSPEKIYLVERNRFWLALKNFPWLLLLFTPVFTMNRWAWNLVAALTRRGAAGNFRRDSSLLDLVKVLGRAYKDGFRGIPLMLKARREIRRSRVLSDREFYRLLWRFRVSARRLAMQDIKYWE